MLFQIWYNLVNEAEYILETCMPDDLPMSEVVRVRRKKTNGKREADLKFVETQINVHSLSEEKLSELFPGGYNNFPDEVYYDL